MIALRFIASHRMCYIEDYLSSTEKFMLAIYLYVCVFVLVSVWCERLEGTQWGWNEVAREAVIFKKVWS